MHPIRRLLFQCAVIILAAMALALLPSPSEYLPLRLKNGLVGIFAVLCLGKILYDTLFYDRYRP
jgi:hypothetical protein